VRKVGRRLRVGRSLRRIVAHVKVPVPAPTTRPRPLRDGVPMADVAVAAPHSYLAEPPAPRMGARSAGKLVHKGNRDVRYPDASRWREGPRCWEG